MGYDCYYYDYDFFLRSRIPGNVWRFAFFPLYCTEFMMNPDVLFYLGSTGKGLYSRIENVPRVGYISRTLFKSMNIWIPCIKFRIVSFMTTLLSFVRKSSFNRYMGEKREKKTEPRTYAPCNNMYCVPRIKGIRKNRL